MPGAMPPAPEGTPQVPGGALHVQADPDISVFGHCNLMAPLLAYNPDVHLHSFQAQHDPSAPAYDIPAKPSNFDTTYLPPSLARNERLRLNRFWYYTRGMAQDTELLERIQDKVNLVRDFLGWEIALCGLLDNDVFERLVSAGMLPGTVRRMESPCSHTIAQPPGVRAVSLDS